MDVSFRIVGSADREHLDSSKNRWLLATNRLFGVVGSVRDRRWRDNRDFSTATGGCKVSAARDLLERVTLLVDFGLFQADLPTVLARSDRARGGRPLQNAALNAVLASLRAPWA